MLARKASGVESEGLCIMGMNWAPAGRLPFSAWPQLYAKPILLPEKALQRLMSLYARPRFFPE
jgi:hypothetical protein